MPKSDQPGIKDGKKRAGDARANCAVEYCVGSDLRSLRFLVVFVCFFFAIPTRGEAQPALISLLSPGVFSLYSL